MMWPNERKRIRNTKKWNHRAHTQTHTHMNSISTTLYKLNNANSSLIIFRSFHWIVSVQLNVFRRPVGCYVLFYWCLCTLPSAVSISQYFRYLFFAPVHCSSFSHKRRLHRWFELFVFSAPLWLACIVTVFFLAHTLAVNTPIDWLNRCHHTEKKYMKIINVFSFYLFFSCYFFFF